MRKAIDVTAVALGGRAASPLQLAYPWCRSHALLSVVQNTPLTATTLT